jgi:hypothetical protein
MFRALFVVFAVLLAWTARAEYPRAVKAAGSSRIDSVR